MPYHHFFYDFAGGEGGYPDNPALTYQDGAIVLADYTLEYAPGASETTLTLDWYTDGTAQGDYIVFVHLYDDIDQPPVAQTDMRPGQGTLPPGNWLSGEFRDTILVDVSALPPGRYRVAIGMFDPITLERLIPNDGDQEDRFFLEDVIIE
jgi:hypothetical protein